jgi:rubrerythrin
MEIIIIENDSKPSDAGFEDKYGFYALFKDLSEKYRCSKCNDFFVYKDNTKAFLICPSCGFEKPTPKS